MLRYPVAIEPGSADHAWGVVFPDLPGCFSAGDSRADALSNAEAAAAAWLEAALASGDRVPPPSALEAVRSRPEFAGWTFDVVGLP